MKKEQGSINLLLFVNQRHSGLTGNNATLLGIRIIAAVLTQRVNHNVVNALVNFLQDLQRFPGLNTLFVIVAIEAASGQDL